MTATPPPCRSRGRSSGVSAQQALSYSAGQAQSCAAVVSRVHSPMLSIGSPSRLFIVQVTVTSYGRGRAYDRKMCDRDLRDDVSAGARPCALWCRAYRPRA
ncbi:MAG: hypothetical protein IKO85_00855 [Bacteroidaceae bacterium]|nr:hypothetical protein [Bacteroidaceae bacterium]